MPATGSISVVLTGGPGGGKSSALATLRDRLSKHGFQVLVVPEVATTLLGNSGGYDAAWAGTRKHVELQEQLLRFQMFQEDTYRRVAKLRPEKPYVILHDRGTLDGRVFCTDAEWADSVAAAGTSEEELLKRYDLVMHMTTVASGMDHLYEYGPESSNPARYHTPDQARETDLRAQEIYAKHPQVRVVPTFADFSQKIDTVVHYVEKALQVDGVAGPRERQPVPPTCGTAAWPVRREVHETQVTFLDTKFTECISRRCMLHACEAGALAAEPCEGASVSTSDGAGSLPAEQKQNAFYEYRREVNQGDRTICARQVLAPEAYQLLRDRRADRCVEVKKRAECFTWEGRHYELLKYSAADGAPLDAGKDPASFQYLDKPEGAPVPPWLVAQWNTSQLAAVQTPSRKLSRCNTAEAASSQQDALLESSGKRPRLSSPSRALRRGPTARLEDLMNSPSLSKAAAVALLP